MRRRQMASRRARTVGMGFQQRMWYGPRREPPEVAAANSHRESAMTGHFTEMIIVSLLASAVLFGLLELFWQIWEDGKSSSGTSTPSVRKGPWLR